MTFDAEEKSIESGQPVELYEFIIGATTFRYTSAEDIITFNSQQWLPRQISRNAPIQSTDERKGRLQVSLPSDDDVASRFIGIVPGELMTLTVTRTHRGDLTEGYVLWKGRVTGAVYLKDGAECQLEGLTTEAAFSRPIPRFKYQGLCNHVLYDTGCGLTASSFQYTGNVSAISGNIITVDGLFASKGAQWARGGYIEFGTGVDFRLVLAQPDDNCTLLLPFNDTGLVGQNVKVFAGCDHTLAVCLSKFSNVDNYGGFPYVPTKNPFTTRL
jgi:uncharacterized phage protein (TIGR02218 family)